MQDLKLTFIQTGLIWRDALRNLQQFDELIDKNNEITDLIILPEMFTTGFSMQPETLAEEAGGRTYKWMASKAAEKNCAITGSFIVKENDNYFNRLYLVLPNGRFYTYDKKHLFRMAGEDGPFTPGNKRVIVNLKDWNISLMVCYDLRFPVWCRNTFEEGHYGYDCQIFVANWPEVRIHAWRTLLMARAIENQAYVVGVNRIGNDGNGVAHSGDSMVVDPMGSKISKTQAHQPSVETITLSATKLKSIRQKLTFGLDWDKYEML